MFFKKISIETPSLQLVVPLDFVHFDIISMAWKSAGHEKEKNLYKLDCICLKST